MTRDNKLLIEIKEGREGKPCGFWITKRLLNSFKLSLLLFMLGVTKSTLVLGGVPPGLEPHSEGPVQKGVSQKPRPTRDSQVDSNTEKEDQESPDLQRSRKFLAFGPSLFANVNAPGVGYSFAGGYSWDQSRVSIRGLLEANVKGNSLVSFLGVGAHYFFLGRDLSPYVGGDLGAGFVKLGDVDFLSGEAKFGFVLSGEVGFQILRTSPVGLGVGLRMSTLLNSTSLGIPYGMTVRLSLLL